MSTKSGKTSEDIFDNWEEMDDIDLNSKLSLLKKTTILTKPTSSASASNTDSPTNGTGGGGGGGTQINPLMKDEDYGGYSRRPIEPIMKILRRPEHERTGPAVVEKPKQPMKSLQQREAEYAEARLRILGAASPPEEPPAPTSTTSTTELRPVGSNGIVYNPHHPNSKALAAAAAAAAAAHANSHSNNAPSIKRQPPAPLQQEGVVRQPRGPDDTNGFSFAR